MNSYLKNKELHVVRQFCLFIVMLYLKACFTSASTADLECLQYLIEYKLINPLISLATYKKIILHLWYFLSDEPAISSSDDNVPFDIKTILSKLSRIVNVQIPKLQNL